MFYAQFVLSKKGPLAKIWLAAHWEKKLSKQQIFETNVEKAVDEIMKPKVKMALRTTGHLLLGIVRIYSRKAKYLLADCNEAFLKIKMAFRPGQVDLAEDTREAAANAITLPEVFTDFDAALPDFSELDSQQFMSFNQSRIDEITLKEDLPSRASHYSDFGSLDDFGESAIGVGVGADEPYTSNMSIERGRAASVLPSHTPVARGMSMTPLAHDDLATPIPSELGDDNFGAADFDQRLFVDPDEMFNDEALREVENMDIALAPGADEQLQMKNPEDSSFALHPLDASIMHGAAERGGATKANKRKRRLIVDEVKSITGDEMKAQMSDYSDTVAEWELAPPTRRLMHLKHCSVERMVAAPSMDTTIIAAPLLELYAQQCAYHLQLHKHDPDAATARQQVLDELAMLPTEQLNDWLQHSNAHPDASATNHAALLSAIREEGVEEFRMMDDLGAPGENDPLAVDLSEQIDEAGMYSTMSPRDRLTKKRQSSKLDKTSATVAAVDETQFDDDGDAEVEDKRWTKRTQHILNTIKAKLDNVDEERIPFTDICKGATRKSAAQKFYTLLVLKKWQAIDVQQNKEGDFEEIHISAGPNIDQQPAH